MKVKLQELLEAMEALNTLSGKSLSAATAFKVARVASALKQPVADFDAVRQKLLQEVGERVNDQQWKINDKERWEREISELLAQEIDLPDEKLTVSDFGSENVEPKTLMQLSWFISY